MRRAGLLFSILSTTVLNSFAQWESHASGFSVQRGINQIISPSASVVWATAYNPSIVYLPCRDYCKSIDGGITWTAGTVSSAPAGSVWSCIAATDENNAWALFWNNPTLGGTLWRTTDAGTTWTQQGAGVMYAGSTSFPDVINFWNPDTGVVVGDPLNGEFEIYTTTDGGTTWTLVDGANIPDPLPGEYGLNSSFAVYNNIIWFGTGSGRIYKSSDRGLNWSVLNGGGSDTDNVIIVVFEDESNGWIEVSEPSGYFIGVRRTTDGGATWTDITTSENFYASYLCYVPQTTDVLVSSGFHTDNFDVDGSSYSLDGGVTWIDIDDSVTHRAVNFFDTASGWSGDVNVDEFTGGMWTYTGGLFTGAADVSSGNSFKLYPNPGDGLFYFSFSAENNEPIHITVTNAPGKIVFDKTYKDKSQTWLRSIDLRHFDKGIYFLKMENNGKSQIEKLIIQ